MSRSPSPRWPAALTARCWAALLLGACTGGGPKHTAAPSGPPALRAPRWPFPSDALVGDDGRLALDAAALPVPLDGTPLPVERVAWRGGFSRVQTAVVPLSVAVDPAALPGPAALATAGPVQLWDLTAGLPIACMAELDLGWSAADAVAAGAPPEDGAPTLLIRPLRPLPVGAQIGVLLTDELRVAAGEPGAGGPLPRPDWFEAALAGEAIDGAVESGARLPALVDRLLAIVPGLEEDSVRLAFSFPVGDGSVPLRGALEALDVPDSWAWDRVLDVDLGDPLPASVWRRAEGRYRSTDLLLDDRWLDLDAEGRPRPTGEVDAYLMVLVTEGARRRPAGTAPVWVFGHGIFSQPSDYLGDPDDPSAVVALAEAAGAVVLGTRMRGLTYTDLPVAVGVGGDFGRLPELTDKLVQGIANQAALVRLAREGALFDDPLFQNDAGEVIVDRSQLFYYGISLGSIEGAAMLSQGVEIDAAVLHVGGSSWSTMLERSSNWPQFELLVRGGLPSPSDRQLLYAASQLFWDAADPAITAEGLQGQRVLFQEAVGDDQVPNLTTELLMRGAGLELFGPAVAPPADMAAAGLPFRGSGWVQLDPGLAAPPEGNRPAPRSGAHGVPRHFPGQALQVLRFLDPEDPGVIEHFCGEAPCSPENPGG